MHPDTHQQAQAHICFLQTASPTLSPHPACLQHEFFDLAREIGSEPVWVLNLGISQSESVEPSGITPWVQDGLDSLEYILGGPGTRWGEAAGCAHTCTAHCLLG